jgi:hypothetical protein
MTLATGSTTAGASGSVTMISGDATGAASGDMTVGAGVSFSTNGGHVNISAGSVFTGKVAGNVTVEPGQTFGGAVTGHVNVGVDHASSVVIGRRADDGFTKLHGLVETFKHQIGRDANAAVTNKHLKITTASITVPALYPSAVFTFDVHVPGAVLSDVVQVAFSGSLGDALAIAHVIAVNSVRITVSNPGYNVAVVTLAAGTFTLTCTNFT